MKEKLLDKVTDMISAILNHRGFNFTYKLQQL